MSDISEVLGSSGSEEVIVVVNMVSGAGLPGSAFPALPVTPGKTWADYLISGSLSSSV